MSKALARLPANDWTAEALSKIDKPLPELVQIRSILEAISEGCSQEEACLVAGVVPRTFYRWRGASDALAAAVLQARARAKAEVVRTVHRGVTRGFVVTETETKKGSNAILGRYKEVKRTRREIAPDIKSGLRFLQQSFPEEYGLINRMDAKRIGGADQVDLGGAPDRPKDALAVINMLLDGDGRFVPEEEPPEPEPEPPKDWGDVF